ADRSTSQAGTAAGRALGVDGLLTYTRRDGYETRPKGYENFNPQEYFGNSVLGKFVYKPTGADRLKLTTEATQRNVRTELRNELSATVKDSRASDDTMRFRATIEHEHAAPLAFIDKASWRFSYTKLERQEHQTQLRLTTGQMRNRVTDLTFEQDVYSGDVQLKSSLDTWGVKHALTYGASLDHTSTSRPRDRTETNLVTGAQTKSFAGIPGAAPEIFPNKNFPDTRTVLAGAYVQDEVAIDRFNVVPGLRVDYYRMDPEPDGAFANTNSKNFQVSSVSDVAVSPKLGVTAKLLDGYSWFGQYARGFRAPPYDDANIGFTNASQGYEILPNANLKPETLDSFETGIRGKFRDGSSFSFTGFYNKYDNFIASRQIGTSATGLLQFQSVNIESATIYGTEAKGDWRFFPDFSLFGAFAFAHGEDDRTKQPIDNVAPMTLVGGLRYDNTALGFGAQLVATHAFRHERTTNPVNFKAPSYDLVDFGAWFELAPHFTINAGVRNLLDRKYFIAQDVVGLTSTNPSDINRLAQPGRNAYVNASVKW
ncbi:MAG: TonB-dependent receptor, partial [Alphaproteobacteria bacterium]|nr:TonB-dependent receptor [Alphaproteobacteria bacterium]